jgi:hypothetical protein
MVAKIEMISMDSRLEVIEKRKTKVLEKAAKKIKE